MLYICATPIGNLKDISLRAIEVLNNSDIILCEDTRLSKNLLTAHNINYKRLVSLHEHNENEVAEKVLLWLQEGLTITQISDAGTPGISDPGARLCNTILAHGYKTSPIPGACAYTSLLSVAGLMLPSLFYGFLPSSKTSRQKQLSNWVEVDYAVCIYEAPHRILDCLHDIQAVFGGGRQVIMGRELTKQFETIKKSAIADLISFVTNDSNQQKGEFVLIIYPKEQVLKTINNELTSEQIKTLKLLLPELPPKKAVSITHKLVGGGKTLLYDFAISHNQPRI
jgi:16S rRNA (cytidine1402-2'-O)-methyltransferase